MKTDMNLYTVCTKDPSMKIYVIAKNETQAGDKVRTAIKKWQYDRIDFRVISVTLEAENDEYGKPNILIV